MNAMSKMTRMCFLFALTLLLCASDAGFAATIHVPGDYGSIQGAINAALQDDIVLVDNGYYAENIEFGGKRITVQSTNGPSVTTIDGGGAGSVATFASGEGRSSKLDGFTITGGSGTYDSFTNSTNGGGVFCASSSPTIAHCIVTNNTLTGSFAYGAGVYCHDADALIDSCVISNNAGARDGGGIYCYNGSYADVVNCTVSGHTITNQGGGIHAGWYSRPDITNCTFADNSSTGTIGGGISSSGYSTTTLINTIVWGNTPDNIFGSVNASYSDIQGGYAGTGNIDAQPLFVGGGDYHLTSGSPCIDVGTSGGSVPSTDIDGDSRPGGLGYDIGSDEVAGELTRINLTLPVNESVLYSAPTFTWKPDGGTNNAYVVDMAASLSGPLYKTRVLYQASWTMPSQAWNRIPSGSYVFWRVRGADLDHSPLTIITSDEIWFFYKP